MTFPQFPPSPIPMGEDGGVGAFFLPLKALTLTLSHFVGEGIGSAP